MSSWAIVETDQPILTCYLNKYSSWVHSISPHSVLWAFKSPRISDGCGSCFSRSFMSFLQKSSLPGVYSEITVTQAARGSWTLTTTTCSVESTTTSQKAHENGSADYSGPVCRCHNIHWKLSYNYQPGKSPVLWWQLVYRYKLFDQIQLRAWYTLNIPLQYLFIFFCG